LDRPARSIASHRVGDGAHGFCLPNHALGEPILHVHEFLTLPFEHSRDGDACPARDDACDFLGVTSSFTIACPSLVRSRSFFWASSSWRFNSRSSHMNASGHFQLPLPLGLLQLDLLFVDLFPEAA